MNFKIKSSIKLKLKSIFLTFLSCIVVLCSIFYFYSLEISHHQNIESQFHQLLTLTLETRKYEKNFLMYDTRDSHFMSTGQSENLTQLQKTLFQINGILKKLETEPIIQTLEMEGELANLRDIKNKYEFVFEKLKDKIKERGFKDYGLEGQMRLVVHKLENDSEFEKSDILTLRKHEKDFIIRKDSGYVDKLHKLIIKISTSQIDQNSLNTLLSYQLFFTKIVTLEKEIGLGNDDGLKGSLKELMDNIEPQVYSLNTKIALYMNHTLQNIKIVILVIALSVITTALIFGWYFAASISKPIVILDSVTRSIVSGSNYQEHLLEEINSGDEIGKLAKNFKMMLRKLNLSLEEAQIQNQQLQKFAADEAVRNWNREGLNMLNDILRDNYDSFEQKTNNILSSLIKYIHANQGAFYVWDKTTEGEEVMVMSACYAYGKKKYRTITISPGEGLVGACWLEKDYILLTDLPQNFLKITSGLGESLPSCILIVPMITNDKVVGIIELVSFKVYTNHEIELVKRFAHMAATSFRQSEMVGTA